MLNKIYDWVDERLDITPLWRDIADHEVPEHVNPAHHFSAFVYCFGGLTFFVMLGLGFTGYLLPWDMKALFATKVGLQIAEATPFIGTQVKVLLAGHEHIVGAQTLTRFFAIHVFFLPGALLGLMGAHFLMIRKQGISGPL
jgi:quinol-cytochrome oxidoreductase complex cytochrome b subunit